MTVLIITLILILAAWLTIQEYFREEFSVKQWHREMDALRRIIDCQLDEEQPVNVRLTSDIEESKLSR